MTWVRLAGCVVAAVQSNNGAVAQQVTLNANGPLFRTDVAGARDEDPSTQEPLTLGSVRIRPDLDAILGYDSNVFNIRDGRGDASLAISPRLDLDDDWGRGSLAVSGSATVLRYASLTSENSLALNGRASGRFDVSDTSQLSTEISAVRVPEARGTGGVGVGLAQPVVRNEFHAAIGSVTEIAGLIVSSNLHADTQRYGDVPLRSGQRSDQRYRNLNIVHATTEVGTRLGGSSIVFVQGDIARERSIAAPAALNRSAVAQTYSLGIRGDLAALVTAQVVVGYRNLRYQNPAYPDFAGPAYNATIDWYARPLVSLRLAADRFFANSGIAGAAGIDTRRENVTLFWDPTRIIRVRLSAAHVDEQYRGASLTSNGSELELSTRYTLAPRITLNGSVGYRDRSSSDEALVSAYRAGTMTIGISLVP